MSRSAPASASASSSSSSSSPSGKRSRDPEDEVYLDNLRSQKRYLSEIMACSLNGLTVGDPLPVNMLESPASFLYHSHRDDLPLQYSPMSEDEDPTTTTTSTSSWQPESQRPLTPTSTNATPPPPPTTTPAQPQSRQRGSETEGRFPSSPSDICHSGDLRRTALLRSVQMRTQPCGYAPTNVNVDAGERMCSKPMEEDGGEDISYTRVSTRSKSCKALDMRLCERGD